MFVVASLGSMILTRKRGVIKDMGEAGGDRNGQLFSRIDRTRAMFLARYVLDDEILLVYRCLSSILIHSTT